MKQIDILVPCYNEEAVLPQFYERTCAVIDSLRDYAFTFIFVNDGSRDRTLPILRQLHEKDRRVFFSAVKAVYLPCILNPKAIPLTSPNNIKRTHITPFNIVSSVKFVIIVKLSQKA